jgi:hypothetical protein
MIERGDGLPERQRLNTSDGIYSSLTSNQKRARTLRTTRLAAAA